MLRRPARTSVLTAALTAALSVLVFTAFPAQAHPGHHHASVAESSDDATPIARLEQRVATHPQDLVAWSRLGAAQLTRGRRTGAHPAFAAAEAAFARIAAVDPTRANAHVGLAASRLGQHAFADALDAAQTASRLRPDDPAVHALLGDVYFALGALSEADALYRLAHDRQPDLGSLVRLAMVRQERGDLQTADDLYHRALDLGAAYGADARDLAWLHIVIGEFDLDIMGAPEDAAAHFEAALAIDSDAVHASYQLARVDRRLERLDVARARLEQIIDRAETRPAYWIELGEVCAELGDAAAAAHWLGRARMSMASDLERGELGHVRQYVDFLLDHGDEYDAERCASLAEAELDVRRDALTCVTAARAFVAAGRTDEAASLMDEALVRAPEDPRVRSWAARVYDAAGRGEIATRRAARLALRRPLALKLAMRLELERIAND